MVPIVLPALRERKSDIPQLVAHFIEKYNKRLNKKIEGVADDALAVLQAVALARQHPRAREPDGARAGLRRRPDLTAKDLPEPVRGGARAAPSTGAEPGTTPSVGALKDIVRQKTAKVEKDLIVKALEETQGNVTRAAKLLQISRKSLQTKMKEFGLRDDEPEGVNNFATARVAPLRFHAHGRRARRRARSRHS